MAKSARQYVFDGMELLPEALIPFVEKRLESSLRGHWQLRVKEEVRSLKLNRNGSIAWDQAALFTTMNRFWADAFKAVLGQEERSMVNELIVVRNRLSHNEKFSYDDAERALDSMRRLMQAISASDSADELGKMRDTILRIKFTELRRNEERRKPKEADVSVATAAGLQPWREVVEPHQDVATGDFLQAEFAADLAQVHNGRAPAEYGDPHEFFSRTYLTDGLSTLLVGAAKRLSNQGGDPVVQLQTNFGGGKTHSMLALYHMAGETKANDLPGLDQLLMDNEVSVPERVSRAVLVGTSRGPQDPFCPEGDREIRTTWGEMAWQLGGESAYKLIADNDRKGVAPGSNLLEAMFKQYAPALILIDEWVAYLRQIYKVEKLPSGSFEANMSFVQSLTEAVKASPGTVLVATLPASQIEVGGDGGEQALTRLQQTFSRVESSWRPASQEESYEIVRRRLFQEIPGDCFHHRDNTLRRFARLYRDNPNDFPQGCADEDYRRKLEKAYPIHPELFDQLYTTWGALEKFQRTRGVLRLMAQVIHELWINNDASAMIMPGSVAVKSARVEPELQKYLLDPWPSIIGGDVDGEGSTPSTIDKAAPNLGKHSATRRVARTIFLGTAPTRGQENRGLDDRQINLGVVQPGESPGIFGDALRRLANVAKHLHGDMGRYWYSDNPSLNRLARDHAGQLEDALVLVELDKALRTCINKLPDRGQFDAVQVAPDGSSEVPDESGGVRAVVLGVAHPHTGRDGSDAMAEAKEILAQRGSTPRVHRNVLVFLAVDARQLDNVKEAMRMALAWAGIVRDTESLNLTQSDSARARVQKDDADKTLETRLKEAWRYLLHPWQGSAEAEVEWTSSSISAQDGVLNRASKKLVSEEALIPEIGPVRLNSELEKYFWSSRECLRLKDLWEYMNKLTYLPRLKNHETLIKAVRAAVGGLVPGPFAYAESWDEEEGEYKGLLIDRAAHESIYMSQDSVIVRADVAEQHRPKTETKPEGEGISDGEDGGEEEETGGDDDESGSKDDGGAVLPRRFVGTVMISSERPAREMRQIIEAIIEQLTTLPKADVSLKLEIDAEVPEGLDQAKVRTIMENATTLKFLEKSIK